MTVRCDFSAPQTLALEHDQIDLAVIYDSSNTSGEEVLCIDPTVWVTSVQHEQHLQTPLPIGIIASGRLELFEKGR